MNDEGFHRLLGHALASCDQGNNDETQESLRAYSQDELMTAIGLLGQVQEIAWHVYRTRLGGEKG